MKKYIRHTYENGRPLLPLRQWYLDNKWNRKGLKSGVSAHKDIGIILKIEEMKTDKEVNVIEWPKDN